MANFKLNMTKEFKDYLDSLNMNRKSIVISKMIFFENTGFLGNCRALGNNLFEYKIDNMKDNIKYFINNDVVLFFNKERNDNETINFKDYINEVLKDVKFTKSLYNEIYNLYNQTNEEVFFINTLKNILKILGKDIFNKITNLNSQYIENDSKNKIETLSQLQDNLNFIIKLKSIDYISEKTNIKNEDIIQILKIRGNLNLNDLQKLIKFLNK